MGTLGSPRRLGVNLAGFPSGQLPFNVPFIVGDRRSQLGDAGGLDPDDMVEIDHATARLRPPVFPEPGSTDQIVDSLDIAHAIRRLEDVPFPGIGREPQSHRGTVSHRGADRQG